MWDHSCVVIVVIYYVDTFEKYLLICILRRIYVKTGWEYFVLYLVYSKLIVNVAILSTCIYLFAILANYDVWEH